MLNFKKWMASLLLVVIIGGVLLTACESKGKVIAVVNGQKVYEVELNQMVLGLYGSKGEATEAQRESIYESLIYTKLIEQDCKDRGIVIDDKEISEYIDTLVKANGLTNKEEFYKQLKDAYSYSEDFVRSLIKSSLEEKKLYESVIKDTVKENDTEIAAAYDQDPNKYKQVEVSHILISIDDKTNDSAAKAKANNLIFRLINGEDFTALAMANSTDTGSAPKGGALSGYFGRDNTSYVAEFVAAAVQLNAGEYTKLPVKTEFGYHIIKADRVLSTFEEVREYIVDSLYGAARETAYSSYLEQLKSDAKIDRKLTFKTETTETIQGTTEEESFKTLQ